MGLGTSRPRSGSETGHGNTGEAGAGYRGLVALVGRRLEHNENLGLAYLRAALRAAGVRVTTHYVNDAVEMARAIGEILAAPPDVVGLSLADGGSAMFPLAVGEALSEAGYRGHVTAGGQFATLARAWLLERHPWLDSVVRLAGERAIVELTERVERGEDVAGIAGVTTRAGDGAPAPVLDALPLELRPERDELPEILGHPAAHMAASRGCLGRCQYCGPAALHTLERREGVRAGIDKHALSAGGVGGVKRRELGAIAEEMAELWHERGVRYFYFVDEHLLPYAEVEALEYIAEWKRELAARDVGAFGIGTMLRADRLTPAVVRAFCDLGLVRVFVGLELATEEEGRRFGRRAPGERELALLGDFAREGVVTVSNLMLVNPYSTPDTVRAGLDLLERIPHGVFEATRMMVYHGTRLMQTMADEGRLTGNPFRYGYRFDDPAMARFAEIFTRLRAEAFYDYSLAFRTHDAFLALALARRLHPERLVPGLGDKIESARRRVNRLYVDAYRRGLELALAGGGFGAATGLVGELRPVVREIEAVLEGVERRLEEVGPKRERPFAPMRAAAAGVVSFVLASACGGETKNAAPATPAPLVSAPEPDDAGAEPVIVEAGPEPNEVVVPDAGAAVEASNACVGPARDEAERQVRESLPIGASCFTGWITLSDPPRADFDLSNYRLCGVVGTHHAVAAEKALLGRVGACLDEHGTPDRVFVEGHAAEEARQVAKAIDPCRAGSYGQSPGVRVEVDAKGRVKRVSSGQPSSFTHCIQKVLSGLRFPCLSTFEVCPEHVIIE